MGLSHIVVRILGEAAPAHQVQPRWARRGNTPVQSLRLALDPGESGVTTNIHPSLMNVISRNHDVHDLFRRPTGWKDRLRLILLGKERFELCRVRTMGNDIEKVRTFLKYGFWNSPWRALYQLSCIVSFSRLLMLSTTSSPVGRTGSSATVSTTVDTSSLPVHHTDQQLPTNERLGEGYLSDTFLRFFAGVLPDAAATSAAALLDLTPNAASKVVCTIGRGGMVVGSLRPWYVVTPPRRDRF